MDSVFTSGQKPEPMPAGIAVRRSIPRVPSARLLNGRREIIIEHGTEEYRLRVTGGGKLLLTK